MLAKYDRNMTDTSIRDNLSSCLFVLEFVTLERKIPSNGLSVLTIEARIYNVCMYVTTTESFL